MHIDFCVRLGKTLSEASSVMSLPKYLRKEYLSKDIYFIDLKKICWKKRTILLGKTYNDKIIIS